MSGFSKPDCDVLIVGGGLTGPALALALATAGIRAHVLDARPAAESAAPGFDGRAYALSVASRRMLEVLGLWDGLAAEAQPILGLSAEDGAAPGGLFVDHAEIEDGPMGHFLEDRFLRTALATAASATPGVALTTGVEVVAQSVSQAGVSVTLGDGRRLSAAVLVGADGRDSGTARRGGIQRIGWPYGQTGLVAAVSHSRPHGGIARQLFWPGGPLAMLPLPGDRSSIVWSERSARARAVAALPDDAFLGMLTPMLAGRLGDIALIGGRHSYPLSLSLAARLTGPRVALVGDAAHGVHPLAGQGLNLGLRDTASLAEVLVEARRRGEDIGRGEVLARYARWRGLDRALLATATDGINRAFSNDNVLLRTGRSWVLRGLSSIPEARRALLREAAGLTGDLPRLARGIPI